MIKSKHKYLPTQKQILSVPYLVAMETGIDYNLMMSDSRKPEHKEPRQIAAMILYNLTPLGTSDVGKIFGKIHATILSSNKRISNLYETDKKIRDLYDKIELATIDFFEAKGDVLICIECGSTDVISFILGIDPNTQQIKAKEDHSRTERNYCNHCGTNTKLIYSRSTEASDRVEAFKKQVEYDSQINQMEKALEV